MIVYPCLLLVLLLVPAAALLTPQRATPPFTFLALDHVVLRVRDAQKLLNFYVGVLGAEPIAVGRFDGALSHLRLGSSMLDLHAYDSPAGRAMHGGGAGLPEGAPLPPRSAEAGTLDHFAVRVEAFDPDELRSYLLSKGHPVISEGERFGALGTGFSMYLRDPENNTVELKGPASRPTL
jgi:catechol 2,3-dioxygenase-like lactoylglutathione lyase family enzyme